jgi:hypothetical protein
MAFFPVAVPVMHVTPLHMERQWPYNFILSICIASQLPSLQTGKQSLCLPSVLATASHTNTLQGFFYQLSANYMLAVSIRPQYHFRCVMYITHSVWHQNLSCQYIPLLFPAAVEDPL